MKVQPFFSDSWASYMELKQLGYKHFTGVHKKKFKQKYVHTESGDELKVHTNMIEEAWKHMKERFCRMNGNVQLYIY